MWLATPAGPVCYVDSNRIGISMQKQACRAAAGQHEWSSHITTSQRLHSPSKKKKKNPTRLQLHSPPTLLLSCFSHTRPSPEGNDYVIGHHRKTTVISSFISTYSDRPWARFIWVKAGFISVKLHCAVPLDSHLLK